MADNRTKEQRSYCMQRIKGKNTKPEILVRKYIHEKGFRFRLHTANLPGRPDIVLKKYKTVIFVNGCFWHGHSKCKNAKRPQTNMDFWSNKITSNKKRDKKNLILLHELGWYVITVWECELEKNNSPKTLKTIIEKIKKH